VVDKKGDQAGEATQGSMILERPGKFRWEVVRPNKQLIIINNNRLLLYDIDLSQITKRKMNYKKQGNPAMLLSSSSETLKQMFAIIKLKKTAGEIWFELKPKKKENGGSDYQWIKIHFDNKKLRAMYIFDNFEQQSEIHFANVVVNSQIPKNKFEFVVPPKVDVLDEG
jgi:outer membrane lipoprotein carrier protein